MSASPERRSWFGTQAAKRKRLPWLAISGALIALLALAAVLIKREPVYQGKPVSFWIAGLATHDARNQEVLADSSAVPYVVRALKSEEGGVIKSIELGWHRLWIKLPGPLQRLSGLFHKYAHVRGNGFWAEARRERRAYPAVDL